MVECQWRKQISTGEVGLGIINVFYIIVKYVERRTEFSEFCF